MGRGLVLVAVLLVGGARVASAGHRVHVVTDPPGAHVYLNDTESGAVCDATPCDIDPPYGESSLIVQLEKYAPEIEGIDVTRGAKTLTISIKLKKAIATIMIEDAAAKGATITIDGADQGKVAQVPARFDVEPGGHQVKVTLRGKTLFDDFIEADIGEEKPVPLAAPPPPSKDVRPAGKQVAATTTDVGSGRPFGSDESTANDDHTAIVKTAPTAPSHIYVNASALVDLDFRRFQYLQPTSGLAPASSSALAENFNSMAGASVELWPFALAGVSALRNVSLYGRVELPVVHLSVSNTNDAQTSSQSYEVSLRYRQWLGDSFALEASGGYAVDQLAFTGATSMVDASLPAATYSGLRGALALIIKLGAVEAYAAVDSRYVLGGGDLATRWATSSVYGLGGLAGLAAMLGPIALRVQFEDVHYMWTFANPTSTNPGDASGAIDKNYGVTMFAGYHY